VPFGILCHTAETSDNYALGVPVQYMHHLSCMVEIQELLFGCGEIVSSPPFVPIALNQNDQTYLSFSVTRNKKKVPILLAYHLKKYIKHKVGRESKNKNLFKDIISLNIFHRRDIRTKQNYEHEFDAYTLQGLTTTN
jgi:hypothetical protein